MSRFAVLVGLTLAVAGCRANTGDDISPGDDGGFLPPGGDSCDNQCPSDTECTRTGECLPPGDIRAVHLVWTIQGQPADETTCAPQPLFYVSFFASFSGQSIGFAPVPCKQGKFTVDKFNSIYDQSEIGIDNGGPLADLPIDSNGVSSFDLDL